MTASLNHRRVRRGMVLLVGALLTWGSTGAEAAGPDTFQCVPGNFDATIDIGSFGAKPQISGNTATFTPKAGASIGADDIAAVVQPIIEIKTSGGKGILVNDRVGSATPLFPFVPRLQGGQLMALPGQTLWLVTDGEVVLGGAIVLTNDQTLKVQATGLEALDCVPIMGQGNGTHISYGSIDLNIGAAGIGTNSSPHGQVTTWLVDAMALRTKPGARVCLDMQRGGDTGTLQLGAMVLGGQTGILLVNGGPVDFHQKLVLRDTHASLLIGPNASLCY